jgi:organic radical activating enzyme
MDLLGRLPLGQLRNHTGIMANKNIFCNVPWTNTHIYWDGSFGACCSERHRPYSNDKTQEFNIERMTVDEWYNSQPMKQIRQDIQGDIELSACASCYKEEQHNFESRRIKENFKSVIFTKQAFDKSFLQTSWHNRFTSTADQAAPIDWHVDLGSECNLACKMCGPQASSRIFNYYKKWDIIQEGQVENWTNKPLAWDNFLTSINQTKNLNRLHFMGGEPMMSKRFKELLEYLIANNRTDISISFVTNGTLFDQSLIDQLKRFKSADIEVSLESIEDNNHYIRQGSDTASVIAVIENLISQQTDTFHVILRNVPQLLNINNYHQYIKWAYDKKVSVQSIPLAFPNFLSIAVLPEPIRFKFIDNYKTIIEYIEQNPRNNFTTIATGRDVGKLDIQLIAECKAMISLLKQPVPGNVEQLRNELAKHLIMWDREFNLDANNFYPEYRQFFKDIGYAV